MNWRSRRCSPACWRTHQKSTLLLLLEQKGKGTWESKCVCIGRVTKLLQWTEVHIYSLDNLAHYGIPNLLEKKYLIKLILRYIDSNSPSVESLLLKLPADPSMHHRLPFLALFWLVLVPFYFCLINQSTESQIFSIPNCLLPRFFIHGVQELFNTRDAPGLNYQLVLSDGAKMLK